MKKIKILLVDNEPEFVKARKEILESEGYEVLTAKSPEDAENILGSSAVDLAIVDLRLRDDKDEADISGMALIRKISSDIPKILLTAFPTVEIARRALKGGLDDIPAAVDLISKAEGADALLRSIALIVEKKISKKPTMNIWHKIGIMFVIAIIIIGLTVMFRQQGSAQGVIFVVTVGLALEILAALVLKILKL